MQAERMADAGHARLIFEAGGCEVDLGRRELRSDGVPTAIGGRAFEIIEALVRADGQLVTKDELMDRVWPGAIVGDNTLQVHISAVRKALGPRRGMLKTESGRGYRLLGPWTHRSVARADVARDSTPEMASWQTGGNLPNVVAGLYGRAASAQRVSDLLSAYRVVTLTGPGVSARRCSPSRLLTICATILTTEPGWSNWPRSPTPLLCHPP
jgi:non-specific serine/threonine protein kinase